MFCKAELESQMMARHTPWLYKKLKAGRVAIAGLGGLGSNIAVMLARSGVGHLLLVDFDLVEPSNLNRQNYTVHHLGMPKTLAMQMQLTEINPFIQVEIRTVRVDVANVFELFTGYEIICEAFDNADAKAMLVNSVLESLPDASVVAASGMAGLGSANLIRTMQPFRRLFICGDFETGADADTGLMAPRVQVCAGHQANMVLRLLVDKEEI
jgi:sulfur carrier protein ThiS adenylyltransferase